MAVIYYMEDDPDIAQNVKIYLEARQMEVTVFSHIAEARRAMGQSRPDLLMVDRNMPDGDGGDLCLWARRLWGAQFAILCLTVRGETTDIVQGFKDGADDYVVKPFALEVLYARILALLRRSGNAKESLLSCGHLLLDTEKMAVFCDREEVHLSPSEYRLIQILMENKGRTVTRERLLEQVWDSSGNFVNDNTLTVTMKRLREKLHRPACLKTVRSFGYRMEESV